MTFIPAISWEEQMTFIPAISWEEQMTFIPAISWEEQMTFLWDDNVHLVLDKQSWILIVLTLWKYSARTHMSLHWTHYSDYESTSLCLYSFTLCANINFIVFGLTRSWIEYSNYYTTGALLFVLTKRLISLEYIYTFCICKTENALSTDK